MLRYNSEISAAILMRPNYNLAAILSSRAEASNNYIYKE